MLGTPGAAPLSPAQRGTTYLWQGQEGPAFLQEQPHLHGGKAKSLSQPRLESQAGILVPPRSYFPASTKAVEWVLSSPATLGNIRADGQCLKGSLLKKRQIKGNGNHGTGGRGGGKKN